MTRSFKIFTSGLAMTGALWFAGMASAHHSTTMFDREKTITLTGTVKEVHWTNPHVAIYVENTVKQPNAEEGTWLIELTSPGNLVRSGWTRNAVKPGDKVTAIVHPLRNGNKGAALNKIVLAETGQTFTYNIRDADRANIDQDSGK
jgi:Family of unknown function (DUF6152)